MFRIDVSPGGRHLQRTLHPIQEQQGGEGQENKEGLPMDKGNTNKTKTMFDLFKNKDILQIKIKNHPRQTTATNRK
jgi:hypothetical protein